MHSETSDSAWFYEALAWLELNRKQVLIGIGVVLLLIAGGYVYSWKRDQTEFEASRALLALKALPSGQDAQAGAPGSEFLKVAQQYPSTSAGERALLLAAGSFFAEGKYQEAQAQFEKFSSDFGSSSFVPIAALGKAASLDALDKTDAAMAAYQNVVSRFPTDPATGRAKLALASLYEAKHQPEEALRLYNDLDKPTAFSGFAREAKVRKQQLIEQNPKLAPTNAPPRLSAPLSLPGVSGKPGGAPTPVPAAPAKQ